MTINWCVIPARGGSKRIPKKNIVDLNGCPMIVWTIKFALEVGIFERVLVSTDDPEIMAIAVKAGAEVPFLRRTANDDVSPVSLATWSAVTELIEMTGTEPTYVSQLMPNCPLRSVDTVSEMIEFQDKNKINSLISASNYGWLNPFWAHDAQTGEKIFPKYQMTRSQDLPKLLVPNGNLWRASWWGLREYKSFYMPDYKLFRIPIQESIDIDEVPELEFARVVHKAFTER